MEGMMEGLDGLGARTDLKTNIEPICFLDIVQTHHPRHVFRAVQSLTRLRGLLTNLHDEFLSELRTEIVLDVFQTRIQDFVIIRKTIDLLCPEMDVDMMHLFQGMEIGWCLSTTTCLVFGWV